MKYMDQTRTTGANEQPTAAGDEPAKRSGSGDAPAAAIDTGCFDCNICLDCAAEPVVTLCGHLYCWPCIYEWLRPDADAQADTRSEARRRCPVCKAAVSPDALVPLYGRGGRSSSKKSTRGLASIPRRPAVRHSAQDDDNSGHHHRDVETDAPSRQPRHHADAAHFDAFLPPPFGDRRMMHPTAGGVLGGMAVAVLPWVLRGQVQAPSMYYPSPYHLSPRQGRWDMELERSLHQLWFFLFVFVLLCWLLF
uniref:E3 ubiquitin-protein ligase RMA n=1 Tax=Arundo donax TaxID=35708 RepID=A0A0A9CS49_ARUDO